MRRARLPKGIYTLELAVILPLVLALVVGALDVTNILRARFAVSAALSTALDAYRLAPGIRTGTEPAARLETARRRGLTELQAFYPMAKLGCLGSGPQCARLNITPGAGRGVSVEVDLQVPLIYLAGEDLEVSARGEALTEEQAVPHNPVLFENALPH
ncbi:MAG: pilus assembly protein [Oligoflexia bacterium]|nr:pilus assembly protein [Oligoflexia bacterium]